MDIKGKVALITGAASGIGRTTALRLAREGAAGIVVADINEEGGQETVRMIEAEGGRAAFVRADVTIPADIQGMISFAEETFGGLDILHNNAGILTGPPGFPDAEPERWGRVLDIDLRAVILGAQYAIPAMKKRGGGVIITTASMAGIGFGYPPDPIYAAGKGGAVLFTASLADLKETMNIRANCVCPGVVDTPMTQRPRDPSTEAARRESAERLGTTQIMPPEDVADAVVELIRDDSLAGRAMWLRNGRPRELGPLSLPKRLKVDEGASTS